jgi:hypothetical protein
MFLPTERHANGGDRDSYFRTRHCCPGIDLGRNERLSGVEETAPVIDPRGGDNSAANPATNGCGVAP